MSFFICLERAFLWLDGPFDVIFLLAFVLTGQESGRRSNFRFYENPYPVAGEVVMVNVTKVTEVAAYVTLLEYGNIEVLSFLKGPSFGTDLFFSFHVLSLSSSFPLLSAM